MTWYTNRKFMAPIFAGIVTILLAVLPELITGFDIPGDVLSAVIGFIWFSAVAILIGDIGYDWIGEVKQTGGVLLDYGEEIAGRTETVIDDQAVILLREILNALESSKSGGEDAFA